MPEPTSSRVVAVSLVIDSSLTVATEWIFILVNYIAPMLKRLGDCYSRHYTFRLATVVYGTVDTRPTPIISKRFFAPLQPVTHELMKNPSALGLGHTPYAAGMGMAALDGLVTAIELFDMLKTSQSLNIPIPIQHLFYLFHVAAGPPSEEKKPRWNFDSALDKVGWSTLPEEIKKRNINFSVINVRPVPQFVELHAATASAQKPWFNVKPPHSLLLTGFPKQVVKRVVEASPEQVPDAKRLRVTSTLTPESPPPNTSNATTPAAGSSPAPSLPQIPPNVQQFFMRIQILDKEIKELETAIKEAQTNGDLEEVDRLKKRMTEQQQIVSRCKAALAAFNKKQMARMAAQGAGTNANSNANPVVPNTSLAPTNPTASLPPTQPLSTVNPDPPPPHPVADGIPTVHADANSFLSLLQNRANPSAPLPIPNAPPTQTAQFPAPLPPQLPLTQQNPKPDVPPMLASSSSLPQNPSFDHVQQEAPRVDKSTPLRWQGTLSWTGTDASTQGRKEVQVQVIALPNLKADVDVHLDTWPSTLQLAACRDPVPDLRAWLHRHAQAVCQFKSQPRTVDPQTNEMQFQGFVQNLFAKKLCAYASWILPTNPSGPPQPAILFIPMQNNTLIGVAFPLTGIPDFSTKSSPAAAGVANQAMVDYLQRLPPEQQKQALAFMRHRHLERGQGQLQPQLPLQPPPTQLPMDMNLTMSFMSANPGAMSSSALTGLFGGGQQRQQQQSVGGLPQQALSGGAMQGSSGGMGNVSYEMMQSFMQRNVNSDGSGILPT